MGMMADIERQLAPVDPLDWCIDEMEEFDDPPKAVIETVVTKVVHNFQLSEDEGAILANQLWNHFRSKKRISRQ